MATKLVSLGPSGTTQLVAAEVGKIIRLFRIILSPSSDVTLRSASTTILPKLKSGASGNTDKEFPKGSVQTAAGEALNALSGAGEATTCWIEYDTVD
jgi:hypothetical protein